MKIFKLFLSIAMVVILVGLICGQARAQRSPKPTPTPTAGSQVQGRASQTTPASTGTTQINRTTGPTKLNNGAATGTGSGGSGTGDGSGGSGTGGGTGDPYAGRITKLRITVVTGGDDLRSNSELRAFLITGGGKRFESIPLNCDNGDLSACHGIPDGTRRTFTWDLSADCREVGPNQQQQVKGACVILPADIRRFGLLFQSHNGMYQSGDNWNLDKLEVEYVVEAGSKPGTFTMYKNAGSPLYRFKSAEEWETDPLSLPN